MENLFDKIYLSITDKIYRLAIVLLGDSNEAQDVVQDLYEHLYNKRICASISYDDGNERKRSPNR